MEKLNRGDEEGYWGIIYKICIKYLVLFLLYHVPVRVKFPLHLDKDEVGVFSVNWLVETSKLVLYVLVQFGAHISIRSVHSITIVLLFHAFLELSYFMVCTLLKLNRQNLKISHLGLSLHNIIMKLDSLALTEWIWKTKHLNTRYGHMVNNIVQGLIFNSLRGMSLSLTYHS